MKWKIAKQFDFCYGHRVWNQKLNKEFCLDDRCSCRHLHGHQGKVIVYLEGDRLNGQGMVTDFKHLSWFKQFLDEVLDHKFIIDKNDPLFETLIPFEFKDLRKHDQRYHTVDLQKVNGEECYKEYYESFVIVNFIPTSENLAFWLWGIVKKKMEIIGVTTSHIQFFETPKSQSQYGLF